MYIERNMVKSHDGSKDFDDSDDDKDNEGNYTVWVISKDVNVVTPYTYDEAISLAGHGCYTVGLLGVCCLSLLAMSIDIFGFSTIITSSACDLEIGPRQRSILLSVPYLGAIATAYVWGYISDTRGRRLSLIIAMWGSFIATTLSAFSPNWIVSAALKFISVSFCSGAQSAAYTLIGECCPISVKRSYLFVLSCSFHVSTAVYTALGYVSLNASFSIDLGYLTFTPWRLLVLCFGLPLGISAVVLHFFYESPKFLANIGNKRQALENLRGIWKRNRCIGKKYPVEKLILEEEYTAKTKSIPLLQSMWEQTLPLFKMPFVLRTLQLYFLNIVLYSTTNSLLSWFPFLATAFISGMSSHELSEGISGMSSHELSEGMCKMIEHSQNLTDTADSSSCMPKSNLTFVWASAALALVLTIVNISICKVTSRKMLVIAMMMIISASAAGCAAIESNIISLFLFFTIFMGVVVNGVVSSYFVDLFPTSYRGMAGCLGMMVSRSSGLAGTSIVGHFIMTHCTNTFYVIAANILCGALVACFLPSDKAKAK